MSVPGAFLIFVDDVISLYLKLVPPTAVRVSNSYCRSVSTCFSGRLPWYRTIEVSWWNYWKSGTPRVPVVDSVKIRFLLKVCTWRKCVSSLYHSGRADKLFQTTRFAVEYDLCLNCTNLLTKLWTFWNMCLDNEMWGVESSRQPSWSQWTQKKLSLSAKNTLHMLYFG